MASHDARQGSGILISSVLMALSVLGVSAITRTVFTSTLAQDSQAAVSGEVCEALAASAIAEMEAQVREGLTRPDGPLMESPERSPINPLLAAVNAPRPVTPGEVTDLTPHLSLAHTGRLAANRALAGYQLDEHSCQLVDQRPLDEAPHERTAVLVLRARAVSGPLGRRTVRSLEQGHTLKLVLAGPPEPFGRFGFFLGRIGGLTDLAQVNAQRERLIAQLGRIRAQLDRGAAGLTGDPREKVLDLLDDIPTVDNATEHTPTVPTGTAGTLFYGLIPDGAALDSTGLDLARALETAAARAEPQVAALPPASAPDLAERVRPVAKQVEDALWSIWANQEAFKILQPSAPEGYPFFHGTLGKLSPEYFARRAHHRFVQPGGALPGRSSADPGAEVARFLAAGPQDGVVHVVSSGAVKLAGTIAGRVMLVVENAAVTLDDVSLGQGTLDRVTVACFGGSVTVRGNSHAYVIAGPGTPVVLERGATLTGGLAMAELAAGTRLEGKLVKSDRYDTGGFGAQPDPRETYTAALSPLVLYRRVTR